MSTMASRGTSDAASAAITRTIVFVRVTGRNSKGTPLDRAHPPPSRGSTGRMRSMEGAGTGPPPVGHEM